MQIMENKSNPDTEHKRNMKKVEEKILTLQLYVI